MPAAPILTLREHADRLLRWFGSLRAIPSFETIAVIDTSQPSVRYVKGRWCLPASSIHALGDFAPWFDQYLRTGYAWVNLSLYGLRGATLILGIELPPNGPTGVPPGFTSVNYSGPGQDVTTHEPIWTLALVVDDIEDA
jgi:hypothetical protein